MSGNPTPSATLFQTFAVSGQISEPHGNLARSGPVDQAMFYRWAAATVTYKLVTGGQTYTDTIAALTPARVYGTTRTTVDLRASRYVIFTEPQRGGAATLWIADEGYYNYLAQQGYVIPLDYCWWDGMRVYQGTGGVATPPPGGSLRGSGRYGALDTQSLRGGGSVSGVSFFVPGYQSGAGTAAGTYVKITSRAASPIALIDFDFGAPGYFRMLLLANGGVRIEEAVTLAAPTGTHGAVAPAFTMTASGGAPWVVPLNQWVWLSMGQYFDSGPQPGHYHIYGQAIQPAGVQASGDVDTANNSDPGQGLTAVMNWGQGSSVVGGGTAYTNAPTDGTIKLSKFRAGPGLPGAPTADWGVGGLAAYNCRDGLGAEATLTDSSGSSHPLAAGAAGMIVDVEGPYA